MGAGCIGRCVPKELVNDGETDCLNGSDEEVEGEFRVWNDVKLEIH